MIRRIKLSNFKAQRSLDLDGIPKLAVIIGPNNIGKSSILQAAAVARYGLVDVPELPMGEPNSIPSDGATRADVSIWFDRHDASFDYFVEPNWSGTPNPQTRTRGGRIVGQWMSPMMSGRNQQGLWLRSVPNSVWDVETGQTRPMLSYLSALRGLPESFAHNRIDDEVGWRGERTGNILNNLIQRKDPRFARIESWAGNLGLRINSISSETVQQGRGITRYRVGNVDTASSYVGSGTLAVAPIIVQGVMCTPGQSLLVEEPESHLHRGAMNGLWKFFQECADGGVQVIATSHSFDFLESLQRRAAKAQVKEEDARVFSLHSSEGGATAYDTFAPSQITDLKDRIVRNLADEA